jgi:cobalamin biosynthesis protein CbiG
MELLSPSTALALWTTVSAAIFIVIIGVVVRVVLKLIKAYGKKHSIKKI